ncbi:MAG: acyltransferase, partial [Actinobacteria bacterium]
MTSDPTGREGRDGWLIEVEALRAVAFVLIVFGHAVGVLASVQHGSVTMALFGAALALSRFSLLAFMTMSSLLVAHRVSLGRSGSAVRAATRMAMPYAVLTVAYLLVGKALAGGTSMLAPQLVSEVVRAWLTGSGFYHLWYVVVAVQIVFVAPLLARWMRPLSRRDRGIVLLAAIAGTMALLGQIEGPITRALPWTSALFGSGSDRVFVFWLAYIVLGVVIGLDYDTWMSALRRYRVPMFAGYAIAVAALTAVVVRQAMDVHGDYQAVVAISRVMQPWIVPFEVLSI